MELVGTNDRFPSLFQPVAPRPLGRVLDDQKPISHPAGTQFPSLPGRYRERLGKLHGGDLSEAAEQVEGFALARAQLPHLRFVAFSPGEPRLPVDDRSFSQ